MRNDVSLWVAIALSVRVHSQQPLSPMPIPCTGAWLSRVPRRDVTAPRAQTLLLPVVRSPRLCGFCLSRSAAPAPLESAAIPIPATLSRAAPANTRCPRLLSDDRIFTFRHAPTFLDFVVVASYYTYRI